MKSFIRPYCLFGVCMVGLALAGCQQLGPPRPSYTLRPENTPVIGIQYFAYGRALERNIARPVPDYQGLPDERVVRDFSRLRSLGVDFVLLAIAPEDVTDSHKRQRLERLFAIRREHPEWPKLAIWVERTASYNAAGANAYVRWLSLLFADDPGIFYTVGARLLVVLAPDFGAWPVYHPALALRYTSPRRNDWHWQPLAPDTIPMQSLPEAFAVFAGTVEDQQSSDGGWVMPRRSGQTLIYAFRYGVRERPSILCIASWNDFRNGSFIEPNTLDGSKVYEALVEEMQHFRAGTNSQ